ncbi:helix-turn-helix domain-containing protein [Corynebacterium aquatimens]|uniref:helix-turn-helix domain-containing protein n=1 Tax=Corynebacterium aquatimens TaxID=1190508 RepID=UPI002540D232|nr:helix-turn-helix domain-containing protein [Corynebacterium aquatimens]QYH19321.1 helix-turn-helix domain-containing protein [Corynebacterium aquatimens]
MTTIETIRQLDDEGMSRRAIAKAVNVSRATVDKYVNQDDFSPTVPVKTRKPGSIVLGEALCAVIDGWLEDDQRMPRKQRHTAQRICDRLINEHGYTGSYSPVQRYVKQWKQDHKSPGMGSWSWNGHRGSSRSISARQKSSWRQPQGLCTFWW